MIAVLSELELFRCVVKHFKKSAKLMVVCRYITLIHHIHLTCMYMQLRRQTRLSALSQRNVDFVAMLLVKYLAAFVAVHFILTERLLGGLLINMFCFC